MMAEYIAEAYRGLGRRELTRRFVVGEWKWRCFVYWLGIGIRFLLVLYQKLLKYPL